MADAAPKESTDAPAAPAEAAEAKPTAPDAKPSAPAEPAPAPAATPAAAPAAAPAEAAAPTTATPTLSDAEKKEKIASFCGLTGADDAVAQVFLEMADWLIEDAVNSYFEHANQERAAREALGVAAGAKKQYDPDDPDQFLEDIKEKSKEVLDKATEYTSAAAKAAKESMAAFVPEVTKAQKLVEENLNQLTSNLATTFTASNLTQNVNKLWGWLSAPEESPAPAPAASSSSSRTAPQPVTVQQQQPAQPARAPAALFTDAAFHGFFPDIPKDEKLIEGRECTLQQTYRCVNNSATPELPLSFRGYLYITEHFACFYVDDSQFKLKMPIVVSLAAVKTIQHSKKNENKIRVVVGEGQAYIFKDFTGPDFDRILATVKTMWENLAAAQGPPASPSPPPAPAAPADH
eukprot:tig00001095_g7042.t2